MDEQGNVFGVYGVASPLVGRDKQMLKLDEIVSDTIEEKKPAAILVVGNQGVGKSRLCAEWLEGQTKRRQNLRFYKAQAQTGDYTYQIWNRLLKSRFSITEKDSKEEIQEKLRVEVTRVFEERRMTEILHFIGTFLGVSFPDNPFLKAMEEDPGQHADIAKTVLRRFWEADSEKGPLVIVLEDLHLADQKSLEIAQHIASSSAKVPLIIAGIGRTEVIGLWPEQEDGSINPLDKWEEIRLGPLDKKEAREHLGGLLKKLESIPEEFIADSVDMTGGNPFFLEQLIRLLISQSIISATDEKWTMDWEKFQSADLPLSVEEAVQARLAALSPKERTLLEMASVMGNVFWQGAILVLTRLEEGTQGSEKVWRTESKEKELQNIIEDLVDREYLMKMPDSWVPRDMEYVFKHNLEYKMIRNAAPPVKVKRWHRLVAQWLESRVTQRAEEHLEMLAQQYEEGGNRRRAAYCYVRAGDMARERFANESSIRFYESGLNLLDKEDSLSRIDALHNLGDVCALVGNTKKAMKSFEEMLHHAYLLDNWNKGGAALGRIARIYRTTGDYQKANEHYRTAQRLFLRASDQRGVAGTLDDLGKVMWLKGDYGAALKLHFEALSIRKRLADDRSTAFTMGNIGIVYQDSGQFQKALKYFQRSLELREKVGDRRGMVNAATYVGSVWQDLGDEERAKKIWKEALKEAGKLGDRSQQAYLLANLGEIKRQGNAPDEGQKDLLNAAEIAQELGEKRLLGECYRKLGAIAAEKGNIEDSKKYLLDALELAETTGNKAHTGAAHRTLAKLAFVRKLFTEAEREYQSALEIFSSLGHHMEVAKTCEVMSEFYEEMGESEKSKQFALSAKEVRSKLMGAAKQADEPETKIEEETTKESEKETALPLDVEIET